MKKKRIVIVCPGRGSYTKDNLNHLKFIPSNFKSFIKTLDEERLNLNFPSITELDSSKTFKTNLHTKGEHASPLIYACSAFDFFQINKDNYEIVAITGNSMGWYIALSMAESLNTTSSFHLIQSMGAMMKENIIGGQIIYPIINDQWLIQNEIKNKTLNLVEKINNEENSQAYLSIDLGGYLVLAGNNHGLKKLLHQLPKNGDFPFQLINHGAFHSPLLNEISIKAFQKIDIKSFSQPKTPLIDGRGHIWTPYSTDTHELYNYSLGHQVLNTYDFTTSISVALKEFAPDHLVLLGPGTSLGGSIGQIMIKNKWKGISDKNDFLDLQKKQKFLISMGFSNQKKLITSTSLNNSV